MMELKRHFFIVITFVQLNLTARYTHRKFFVQSLVEFLLIISIIFIFLTIINHYDILFLKLYHKNIQKKQIEWLIGFIFLLYTLFLFTERRKYDVYLPLLFTCIKKRALINYLNVLFLLNRYNLILIFVFYYIDKLLIANDVEIKLSQIFLFFIAFSYLINIVKLRCKSIIISFAIVAVLTLVSIVVYAFNPNLNIFSMIGILFILPLLIYYNKLSINYFIKLLIDNN